MTLTRSPLLCCSLVFSLALAGCSPWTVVQQAEPNPFVGQKDFAFSPLEFSSKPTVDPGKEEDLAHDLEAMGQVYATTLRDAGTKAGLHITEGRDPFTIHSDVTTLDLGGFWVGYSDVGMTIELRKPDGTVLDKITVDRRIQIHDSDDSVRGTISTVKSLDSGNRIRQGAKEIADVIVEYLSERTGGS
ncbi:MAG TPA: hypothetical protein VFZ65_19570 [Planctomycetota bacterium]|nr:hypothetical protein [Planctomycetota bacterium]